MGLRFTDRMQPHYPPESSFHAPAPHYDRESDSWFHSLPQYFYEVDVEYHPSARTAPAPRRTEPWRIGIVQNVLYERIEIEYLDQEPYAETWRRPVLDIGSEAYRPFYNEPQDVEVILPVPGTDRIVHIRERIIAVHELFYGPRGLGRLIDPWDRDGYVPMQSQIIRLRIRDQPHLYVRNWKGSELVRVVQVLALRFWVLAMSPSGHPIVLGLSPIFTLAAWMRLPPRIYRALQPRPEFAWYTWDGMHTRIMTTTQQVERYKQNQVLRGSPPLRPTPGSSPLPLLTGISAVERAQAWIRENGLSPTTATVSSP